jgi:tetratricopeptide (TPR) repeat protein
MRAVLLAVLSVFGLAVQAASQEADAATPALASEPAVLLAEAEQHFAKGNLLAGERSTAQAAEQFRAALLRYQAAAAALGGGNGYLLYNIGNCYLRLGDLGRAILHYREAQQLIPSDPNLQQSLRHARSLRRDRIEPTAAGGVARLLFFWHFTMPLRARTALLLTAWNVLWLLALLPALAIASERARRLYERLRGCHAWQRLRRPVAGTVVAVAAVVAVAMGSSVAVELFASRDAAAVVVAPEVVARRGDGAAYEASFDNALHAGTELVVVERRNDWYQVALADGRRAWLPAHAVAVVGEGASPRLR